MQDVRYRQARAGGHGSCLGYRDFGVRSGSSGIDGSDDKLRGELDARPARRAENDDGNGSRSEVLLVLELRVSGDQNLEPLRLGRGEQLAVVERGPAQLIGSDHFVPRQQVAQRRGRTLIE